MANLNRYKFTFGNKTLTLTTEHDNLFMEEVERVAKEKYKAIKEQMPAADDEVLAILLAVNSLSTQLSREIEFDDKEKELEDFSSQILYLTNAMLIHLLFKNSRDNLTQFFAFFFWNFTTCLSCSVEFRVFN